MSNRGAARGPFDQLGLGLPVDAEVGLPAEPEAVPDAADVPRQVDTRVERAVRLAGVAVAEPLAPSGRDLLAPAEGVLDGLTDEQRDAVTHGDGPLLIVAGAGTGKTTVLTRRIGHLITTRAARPEQVLALTFTDRAAAEMEERVDRLVPYGYTQAWISTFHAFGDRVLARARARPRAPAGLSRAQPGRAGDLHPGAAVRVSARSFPSARATRPATSGALIALISRAKDEDVSPDEYAVYADRLTAEAAAAPDDAVLAERARQQRELAAAYRTYQDLLAKEGRLDFGDLITLTVRLLRQHPAALARYQEQFHHILVDEFQDTNYAQFELVKLLAGTRRNLTVVADDDQAIYRFRGASYSNITYFTEAYADARTVVLTRNYRSTQFILDAAYRLIRHNDPDRLEVRIGIDKRLHAVAGPGVLPRHLHYDSLGAEADGVADRIAERVAAGAWRYRDVAILVRGEQGRRSVPPRAQPARHPAPVLRDARPVRPRGDPPRDVVPARARPSRRQPVAVPSQRVGAVRVPGAGSGRVHELRQPEAPVARPRVPPPRPDRGPRAHARRAGGRGEDRGRPGRDGPPRAALPHWARAVRIFGEPHGVHRPARVVRTPRGRAEGRQHREVFRHRRAVRRRGAGRPRPGVRRVPRPLDRRRRRSADCRGRIRRGRGTGAHDPQGQGPGVPCGVPRQPRNRQVSVAGTARSAAAAGRADEGPAAERGLPRARRSDGCATSG